MLEYWPVLAFAVIQLMTFAALRQQVKDLRDDMAEEKLERKQLDERVRALELSRAAGK